MIRNAENYVLIKSKNIKLIQKCIDYDNKCLEVKHNIYKIIENPPRD